MAILRRRRIDQERSRRSGIRDEEAHHEALADQRTRREEMFDHEMDREDVVERRADGGYLVRGWLRTLAALVGLALAVVETLLLFRFVFLLADANRGNGFVDFIYDATGGMVTPFEGIFNNESIDGGGIFEPASLVAMAVYLLVGLLVMALIRTLASGPVPSERSVTTSHREQHGHERDDRGHSY